MRRFLKGLFVVLVALGLCGAGAVAWLSRDTAATHPSLAQADLPPLIPVRDFWADTSSEWRYRVSADGAYIAHSAVRRTQEMVLIKRRSDNAELAAIPDIWRYFWSDIAPALYVVTNENRMWKVDPENAEREAWVDVTPRGFQSWYVNTSVRSPDDPWIVTSRDRNPAFPDIYKVRQDGGGKELFLENGGKTLSWLLDFDYVPLLRFDRLENDQSAVLVRDNPDGATWRELFTVDPFTRFWIMAIAEDAKTAIAFSSRDRDRAALVRVDLDTGAETVIAENPERDLDHGYTLDPASGQVDLVTLDSSAPPIALTPKGETLARLIAEQGDTVFIENIRTAGKGRFVSATLSPDAKNYIYMLFDLEKETSTRLGEFSFRQKHLEKLVETQEITFPARDGLDIPALLLRPKGVSGPVPTIIEVHGGPASHVIWEYHHFRQFLVNRGYAVLSVNFRGSTGFGRAFQAAAFKQFGRAMQTDLYDAADWAVAQGIADPDALAIMGGSYGGYAAGMGATEKDGPFDVAVVEHAVLDLPYQMRNNPFAWGLNTVYMERYFGKIDDPQDLADMESYSPITRAAELAMPTLVVAGKRDRIVGFEQSEEFLRATRAAGHDPQELIFEDEGHGIDRWQNRIRHARVVEDFLAEHLGGRSGSWDYIELPAEYLD